MVVAAVAVLTMVWGNLAALTQENVKRLLAYSADRPLRLRPGGHPGRVGARAGGAVVLRLRLPLFTAGRLRGHLIVLERGEYVALRAPTIAGLASRAPGLAAAMLVFLIALTGIPPTGGFVGKFYSVRGGGGGAAGPGWRWSAW